MPRYEPDGPAEREADREEHYADDLGRAEAEDYAAWEKIEAERAYQAGQRRADLFRDFLIDLLRPIR